MKFIQVHTTVDSKKKAEEVAKVLLDKRLSGCVQIFPTNSSYWWKGKMEEAKEWLIIAKAREDDYVEIESTLKSVHPYSVPEILAVPVLKGSKAYLDWLAKETERK